MNNKSYASRRNGPVLDCFAAAAEGLTVGQKKENLQIGDDIAITLTGYP